MTLPYQQNLDHAYEASIGALGASPARVQHYLDKLAPAIPGLKAEPQREAIPVLGLPYTDVDYAEIEEVGRIIAEGFDTLVVVGMGGSSLSGETMAFIRKPGKLQLRFVDNIDSHSLSALVESVEWKKTVFLIISKSGGTVETLAQSSVLLRHAKAQLADYAKHFFVITITDGNVLHTLAKSHGIRVIEHCPKLGGRFSILGNVGLIPAAAMGLDIRAFRAGAAKVIDAHFTGDYAHAPAALGAALHMALREKQVRISVLMHYCDRLGGVANWYRQSWGESLGKCDLATTPIRSRMTTDQHSQLQLYMDGPKDKLFTLLLLDGSGQGEAIDFEGNADPRLAFLKGKTLGDLMVAEQRATISSLVQRGCPVRSFSMGDVNEEVLGALIMHFALEVMFTAKLMDINAFDQPAVEDSKKFALHYLAGNDDATTLKRA
ncbi:MAG: hypothetical protein K2Q01_00475 [Rickettsiales bacterium]|nr:hypothetical protein [Rickettsiales bacterium]